MIREGYENNRNLQLTEVWTATCLGVNIGK